MLRTLFAAVADAPGKWECRGHYGAQTGFFDGRHLIDGSGSLPVAKALSSRSRVRCGARSFLPGRRT